MGMSASQARYIALTARMNDVEYEAQQINQQRLVLSNKMNEVQERAMNMDVPTPPSKQDYMYPVYIGRKGKNTYKVAEDGNGNPTVYLQGSGNFVTPSNIKGVVGDEGANFDKYLNKEIGLGFHSHNNQQLSYALSMEFAKLLSKTDKRSVDSLV